MRSRIQLFSGVLVATLVGAIFVVAEVPVYAKQPAQRSSISGQPEELINQPDRNCGCDNQPCDQADM